MIIRNLRASFGLLSGAELTLSKGLNVISGPNESGKSTWTAFILAMLFGLDTSERDSKSGLADKNLYLPHGGAAMQGAMQVETPDGEFTIERFTARAGAPMQGFRAYRTASGDAAEFLRAPDAGEALTGVDRETYQRSAFIGRAGLPVGQSPELERRIQSLLTSGGEKSSFSETESRLRDWLNKRTRARTGALAVLSAQLEQTRAQLGHLKALAERETALVLDTNELTSRIRALEETLERIGAHALGLRVQALEQARGQEALERQALENAQQALSANGCPPDAAQLHSLYSELARLHALEERVSLAQSAWEEAVLAHKEAEAARLAFSSLAHMSAEDAWQKASEDAARMQALESGLQKTDKPGFSYFAVLTAAVLLFVCAGVLLFIVPPLSFIFAGIGALCLVFCRTRKKAVQAGARDRQMLNELRAQYGGADAQALLSYAARYREACTLLSGRAEAENALRARRDEAAGEYAQIKAALLSRTGLFAPGAEDLYTLKEKLDALSEGLARLEELRLRADTARVRYETLKAGLPALTPDDVFDDAEPPDIDGDEVREALDHARAELEGKSRDLATVRGEMRHFGDLAALQAAETALVSKIDSASRQAQAISLSLDVLSRAESGLQLRFAPALNAAAGEMMAFFTNERYAKVLVDRSFSPMTAGADQISPLTVQRLSRGTADQLYLALRLAICRLTLPQDNPPPVVLDDALVAFDDIRMARVLDYLLLEGKSRQIILFSCHAREAEYLQGKDGVTVTRL